MTTGSSISLIPSLKVAVAGFGYDDTHTHTQVHTSIERGRCVSQCPRKQCANVSQWKLTSVRVRQGEEDPPRSKLFLHRVGGGTHTR